MKSLIIIITILFICSPRDVSTQVSQEWAKRLSTAGNNNDYVNDMTSDAAGNVYVTGSGSGNYLTVKYSPEGTVLWQAAYNGPANDADYANSVTVDAAGNVYVTGRSFGNGTGTDFATIKYDASGNQLWVQRYNGTNNDDDEAVSVVVDASGNVYAGGWSSHAGTGIDYAIVKYSAAGSQVWVRFYNGSGTGNDFMSTMITDAAGNIYATGKSRGSASDDAATVKYSSSGTLLWSARYEGSDFDKGTALVVDGTGSVIVTGTSTSASTGKDYLTVKYNNAGVQQWVKKYSRTSTSVDEAIGVTADASGNIYVTGSCSGTGTPSLDYITLSYNSNGDARWTRSFTGGLVGEDDVAASIDIDGSGNIYVTGSVKTSGSDFDFGTVKYSSAGSVIWSVIYEGILSADDRAVKVKTDNAGNVYVAGNSSGLSGLDFMTVKYSQPIGITPIGTEVPADFSLGQNYPNPFNPTTNIKLQIPKNGFVKLAVFDITGKEVALLVNEELGAGSYNVDFDASHLSSGTYFYRMETNSFTEVKKMILVK